MDISITQTYNASPSAVAQALLSSELTAKRAKLVRVDDYTRTVDGFKAMTAMNILAERFPSKARALARSGAKVTIITVASGDSATCTVDSHGLPVEVSTALKLSGDAITAVDPSATLKVKIPLLGGKIEKGTAGMVDRLLARDTELVEEVIEEQGL